MSWDFRTLGVFLWNIEGLIKVSRLAAWDLGVLKLREHYIDLFDTDITDMSMTPDMTRQTAQHYQYDCDFAIVGKPEGRGSLLS